MTKRNKGGFLIDNLTITDYANEGKAIGRFEGKVVFVDGAMPGDVVDVRVYFNKKDFAEARIINFREKAPQRLQPVCRHFTYCGGCKWQHVPYHEQLQFKQRMVQDNIKFMGKVEVAQWETIIGSENEYRYRNKLEFAFSNRRWVPNEILTVAHAQNKPALGYHIQGFWDKVLHVDECHLQPEPTNAIRNAVYDYSINNNITFFDTRQQTGLLRNLMIRVLRSKEVLVLLVFKENNSEVIVPMMEFLKARFPEITSLNYTINSKRNDSLHDLQVINYSGNTFITETLDGLKFRISPQSFFQTNTSQAEQLYRKVKEYAGLTGKELVYDLYTGTGSIAIYVAHHAARVVGIEYVEPAIIDARLNAGMNNIENCTFIVSDMADALTEEFVQFHGKPDVVITDPPRAGMHPKVIDALLSLLPKRIVYVSCNPATQARDLQMLDNKYIIKKCCPVDMFPHTHHLENVALLELRDNI
jgi:23S rRNA (uracil1939-C5)-methyltransferase